MIDDVGNIVDAVYYNKLVSDCGSVIHSGDNEDRSGVQGCDEFVTLHLQRVGFYVSYIGVLVCSYDGKEVQKGLRTAVTLYQNDKKLIKVPLEQMMNNYQTYEYI